MSESPTWRLLPYLHCYTPCVAVPETLSLSILIGSAKQRVAATPAKSFEMYVLHEPSPIVKRSKVATQLETLEKYGYRILEGMFEPSWCATGSDLSEISFINRVQPVGSKIAEVECIAGYDWYVWRGVSGAVQTITFVNQEPNEEISEFDGDLTEFMCTFFFSF